LRRSDLGSMLMVMLSTSRTSTTSKIELAWPPHLRLFISWSWGLLGGICGAGMQWSYLDVETSLDGEGVRVCIPRVKSNKWKVGAGGFGQWISYVESIPRVSMGSIHGKGIVSLYLYLRPASWCSGVHKLESLLVRLERQSEAWNGW
jgi:hypothetical protein